MCICKLDKGEKITHLLTSESTLRQRLPSYFQEQRNQELVLLIAHPMSCTHSHHKLHPLMERTSNFLHNIISQ
jgi:hypothetical protein